MEEEYWTGDDWDAGFEAGRRVVVSRLGPFLRVFPRPQRYTKRFYHRLYDLKIEDWPIQAERSIFGGFCCLQARLVIRFQPTVRYVEENLDALPDIGNHIKSHYAELLQDTVEQLLLEADGGAWVDRGLGDVERRIETAVNETLVVQNIRCRTRCEVESVFEKVELGDIERPSGQFRHERAFLEIMRKNYAFRERHSSELMRQELNEREARLKHEAALLEQLRRDEEQRRLRESYETARLRAELEEEERREAERLKSEERRKMEQIKMKSEIRQMELSMEVQDRKLRYQAAVESDELLRREVELLALEKQRAALSRGANKVDDDDPWSS